jgi:hypothetical protein
MRGEIDQAEDDGARWLPAKELDPATYDPCRHSRAAAAV